MLGAVTEMFAQAWKHHQANDLHAAEQLYRAVVQRDSTHSDAWCFLGAACQAQGKLHDAEVAFRRAIQLLPTHTCALNCLGILLAQQSKFEAAGVAFEQLLAIHPMDPDGNNNLGLVWVQQGQFDEAINCYNRALQVRPDFVAARNNLQRARDMKKRTQGCDAQSVSSQDSPRLQAVTGSAPEYQLGNTCAETAVAAVNQGVALAQQGRMDEAKVYFEQAAQLQPTNVDAHNDLGSVFVHQRRYSEAVERFQKVLSLRPDHVEAHYNLAIALHKQGRVDEAVACYRQALAFRPEHLDAQNNLGNLYKEQAKLDEALACYEEVLRWHPQHAGSHFNRALAWLLKGDWQRGWTEYEWRWHTDELPPYEYHRPRWDGGPLNGRTILVFAEQGLGDTLQFIRYLPLVKERGGRVVFVCQPPLARILTGFAGVDVLVPRGSLLPPFDVQAPLLSLPGIFRTSVDNAPARIPYLSADSALIEHWRRQLAPVQDFMVGIAWQGRPTFRDDARRSIPLKHFAPLAQIPGVRLISLQKGPGTEQLAAAASQFPVLTLDAKMDEANGAFMDTAAVIKNLDLIISSDTAVPHLAGALDVPVWVALPLCPDWRWLIKGDKTAWYPTMRLFRQTRYGRWEDVFERLAENLRNLVSNRNGRAKV